VLIAVGLLALIPIGIFVFYWAAASGSSSGSPELAAEWREQLKQYPDPAAASASRTHIAVIRFRNGEWLFGCAQNSHGIWLRGGGTVVVKDSTGRTRAFFGHVCGAGLPNARDNLPSLDDYYKQLVEMGFTEHFFQ
jgi:hypothetical protein